MIKLKYFLILLLSILPFGASASLTAGEVLAKTASQLEKTSGLECRFVLNTAGKNIKGILRASGSKFSVETPAACTWFNGRNMWSYNPSSSETTLTVPTAQELAETNPLSYLKGYSGIFNVAFAQRKVSGKYIVLLTPKKKNNAVKSVEITIDSKSYRPEKFVVSQGASKLTVIVNSLVLGKHFAASTFEYPAGKYRSAEIIDLR